jgi:hypothetical protein
MRNDTHDKSTQDNEELSFISLAAATANAVRWLMKVDEEKQEETGRDSNAGKTNKQSPEDESRYIDTRLKEIAAWERRFSRGRFTRRTSHD